MPIWFQALVDVVGILLLALALIVAAGGRQGSHAGPVKLRGGAHKPEHVRGRPPVQRPIPAYVAAYIERGGARPHGMAVAA